MTPATVVRDPSTITLVEAVQIQCDLLMKAARRAQERGYYISITGLNKTTDPDALKYSFAYMNGGFDQFIKSWCDKRAPRIVAVHVHVDDPKQMFDGRFSFGCEIPDRAWSREIVAALRMVGSFKPHVTWKEKTAGARADVRGTGLFKIEQNSNCYRVTGNRRAALEGLLRILEMPQHRELLLGERS